MVGFIAVIIVFSFVVLIHELGHFFMARRMGVKVERFSLGLGKVLWSKKFGDTEYAVGAIPFGGYVKMAGEEHGDKHEGKPYEFSAKPPGKRFWILLSGAGVNYIMAFLIFSFISPTARVGAVIKDMPAHKAGMETGDRIISVDGESVKYWYQLIDIISEKSSEERVSIKAQRDDRMLDFVLTPKMIEYKDLFGRDRKSPKIGIWYYGDVAFIKANPLEYLKAGASQTWANTALTYTFLWRIITREESLKDSAAGPIGIAAIIAEAVKVGFAYLLYLVAHINLALAIFNLLPFPVLDGGHIMFLGLEKIRRRPLPLKAQEVIQYAAVSLMVAFFLFVTYNDIVFRVFKK